MNSQTLKLLQDVNRAIIKFRGVYSAWSKKHGISYNEMLVLYTIRDIRCFSLVSYYPLSHIRNSFITNSP